jgi:hypothetical protein
MTLSGGWLDVNERLCGTVSLAVRCLPDSPGFRFSSLLGLGFDLETQLAWDLMRSRPSTRRVSEEDVPGAQEAIMELAADVPRRSAVSP